MSGNMSIHYVERIVIHDSCATHDSAGRPDGTRGEITIFARNYDGELFKFSIYLFSNDELKVSLVDDRASITSSDVKDLPYIPYQFIDRAIGEMLTREQAKKSMRGEEHD